MLSFKKWKSLRSSLKGDFQSLLEEQNLQTQENIKLLAEKQDQQITVLHSLSDEDYHNPPETETDSNWDRLVLFSDGVFAIAITLLVLDIHTPTHVSNLTDLLTINIPIFVYTFLYIGFFWNLHRQIFGSIKRINTTLVMFNLLALMSIVFMPFTTSLRYEYGDTGPLPAYSYSDAQLVAHIYAFGMFFVGFTFALLWFYASYKRRLLKENVNTRTIRRYKIAILIPTIVYLFTIPITFFGYNYKIPPINLGVYYYFTGVDVSQLIWLILSISLIGYIFLRTPFSLLFSKVRRFLSKSRYFGINSPSHNLTKRVS